MSNDQFLSTIETTVRSVVNNQNLVVKADSRLMEDLGLESIDLLDVSSELENTLGWELDFRDVVENMKLTSGAVVGLNSIRVQDLLNYIATKQ